MQQHTQYRHGNGLIDSSQLLTVGWDYITLLMPSSRAGILPAVSLTFSRQTALFCWLSRDRFCVSASFKLQQTSEAAWLTTWFHSYQSWYEWNRVKSSFPRVSLCRGRIPARWWLPCLFWWQFNQLTEQMQADASTRDRGETRMADVELLHNNTYRQI